jgi:hypothetical protein
MEGSGLTYREIQPAPNANFRSPARACRCIPISTRTQDRIALAVEASLLG